MTGRWFSRVLRKSIILHTKQDQSIEGVLWETTRDGVLLRSARLLGGAGQADTSMAGEVFVPRENVAFAQLDE